MNIENLLRIPDNKKEEVEAFVLYLSDYRAVSRPERGNIYFNLLDLESTDDIKNKYGEYMFGYNLQFKNPETIIDTLDTRICFCETKLVSDYEDLSKTNNLMKQASNVKNLNLNNNTSILTNKNNHEKEIRDEYFDNSLDNDNVFTNEMKSKTLEESSKSKNNKSISEFNLVSDNSSKNVIDKSVNKSVQSKTPDEKYLNNHLNQDTTGKYSNSNDVGNLPNTNKNISTILKFQEIPHLTLQSKEENNNCNTNDINNDNTYNKVACKSNFCPLDKKYKLINLDFTYETDICLFYTEYRMVILFDISQSMVTYDFDRQMNLFEKIDIYIRETITKIIDIEKFVVNAKFEKVQYSPKLICSFVVTYTDEDCSVLLHEIYLDKSNYKEFLEIVIRKIKRSILDYSGVSLSTNKKEKERVFNAKNTSDIIKILHQSLYILDLLPRRASPIIVFFSDSCLCCSQIGVYNNYLMQMNRVDVTVHNIVLGSFCKKNMFSITNVPNYSILKYVSDFTGGVFIKEDDFCTILKIKSSNKKASHNNNKNIISLGSNYNGNLKNTHKHNKYYDEFNDNDCNDFSINNINVNEFDNANSNILSISNNRIDMRNLDDCNEFNCSSRKQYRGLTYNPCDINDLQENFIDTHCSHCALSVDILLCKKPLKLTNDSSMLEINKDIFEIKKSVEDLGFNFRAIPSLKIARGLKLVHKEVFEKYTLVAPINRIIETRIRESFRMKKFNLKSQSLSLVSKLTMELEVFPEVFIVYEASAVSGSLVSSKEKNIKIRIKSPFEKINFLKNCQKKFKEDHPNTQKIVTFIKEIIVSDKLISFFSQSFNFELDFFNKHSRDEFVSSQKSLIEMLSELTIHSWHRFFNVENVELLIAKNYCNVDYLVRKVFTCVDGEEKENEKKDVVNNYNITNVGSTDNPNSSFNNLNSVGFNVNQFHNNIQQGLSNNNTNSNNNGFYSLANTQDYILMIKNKRQQMNNNNINTNNNTNNFKFFSNKINPSTLQLLQQHNGNLTKQIKEIKEYNSPLNFSEIEISNNLAFSLMTENDESIIYFNILEQAISEYCDLNLNTPNNNSINMNMNNTAFNSNNNNNLFNNYNSSNSNNKFNEYQLNSSNRSYIKLISKTENYSKKNHLNGFCLMNLVRHYDNLGILYLGFFQCFINLRRRIVREITDKLTKALEPYFFKVRPVTSERHLILLVPSKSKVDINVKYSVFTYLPSFKLSDNFLTKKSYKFPIYNAYLSKLFLHEIVKNRLIESFVILNVDNTEVTLVNRVNISRNKVLEENLSTNKTQKNKNNLFFGEDNNNNSSNNNYNYSASGNNTITNSHSLKSTAIIYKITVSKEEVAIEIHVEPGSGYVYKSQDNELKVYEEKTFFTTLFKYFRDYDKQVFDYLRNVGGLVKEIINSKQKTINEKLMKIHNKSTTLVTDTNNNINNNISSTNNEARKKSIHVNPLKRSYLSEPLNLNQNQAQIEKDSNINSETINNIVSNNNALHNNTELIITEQFKTTCAENQELFESIFESTLERADFCIFNSMDPFTSKCNSDIINTLKNFHADLDVFRNNLVDDKHKFNAENTIANLTLFSEREYIILKREKVSIDYTYIEKQNLDRFHYLFKDLFFHLSDYHFKDCQNNIFFCKLLNVNAVLLVRYPAIDRVLNCCNNQKHDSKDIVIHIKFFLIDLNNFSAGNVKGTNNCFEVNTLFKEIQSEIGTPLFVDNWEEEEFIANKLHSVVLQLILNCKKSSSNNNDNIVAGDNNCVITEITNTNTSSLYDNTILQTPKSKNTSQLSVNPNNSTHFNTNIINNIKLNITTTNNNNVQTTNSNNTDNITNNDKITNKFDYLNTIDTAFNYVAFVEKFYDVLYLKNALFSYVDNLTELNKEQLTSYVVNLDLNDFYNVSSYANKHYLHFNFFLDEIYNTFLCFFRHIESNVYCNYIEEFDQIKSVKFTSSPVNTKNNNHNNNNNSKANNNADFTLQAYSISNSDSNDNSKGKTVNNKKSSNQNTISSSSNNYQHFLTSEGPLITKHSFKDLFTVILTCEEHELIISDQESDRQAFKQLLNQLAVNYNYNSPDALQLKMEVKFVSSVENIFSEIPANSYNNKRIFEVNLHNKSLFYEIEEREETIVNLAQFNKKIPSFIHLSNKEFFIKVPDVHKTIINNILSQMLQLSILHEVNCLRILHNNQESNDLVYLDHQRIYRILDSEILNKSSITSSSTSVKNISNSSFVSTSCAKFNVVDKKKVVSLLDNCISDALIGFKPNNGNSSINSVYLVNWDSNEQDVVLLKEFARKHVENSLHEEYLEESLLKISQSNTTTITLVSKDTNNNNVNISTCTSTNNSNVSISKSGNTKRKSREVFFSIFNKRIFSNEEDNSNNNMNTIKESDFLSMNINYKSNISSLNNVNSGYKRFTFEEKGVFVPVIMFFYPITNILHYKRNYSNTNNNNYNYSYNYLTESSNNNNLEFLIRWVCIDKNKQGVLFDKMFVLISNIVKKLNKQILLSELKTTNNLDERLIPKESENEVANAESYKKKREERLKQLMINNDSKKTREKSKEVNKNNKVTSREKVKSPQSKEINNSLTVNNTTTVNTNISNFDATQIKVEKTDLSNDFSLENVFESRYVDSSLEVFTQLISDAKKLLSIKNNSSYFTTSRLIDSNNTNNTNNTSTNTDVWIFKFELVSEHKNNSNLNFNFNFNRSIIESNRQSRAFKLGFTNSEISGVSGITPLDTTLKINNYNNNFCPQCSRLVIVTKYYGVKKPSQTVLEMMRQFVNDRVNLVKLKGYWEFFSLINKQYLPPLPSGLDVSHKIANSLESFKAFVSYNNYLESKIVDYDEEELNKTIYSNNKFISDVAELFFKKGVNVWDKLLENISEIDLLDVQYLSFASNKINLNLLPITEDYLDPYSETNWNFISNLKEYFTLVRTGYFHKLVIDEMKEFKNMSSMNNIINRGNTINSNNNNHPNTPPFQTVKSYTKDEIKLIKDGRISLNVNTNTNNTSNNNSNINNVANTNNTINTNTSSGRVTKINDNKSEMSLSKSRDAIFLFTSEQLSGVCVIVFVKTCYVNEECVFSLSFNLLKKKDAIDKVENLEDWICSKSEVLSFIYSLVEDLSYVSYLLYLRKTNTSSGLNVKVNKK